MGSHLVEGNQPRTGRQMREDTRKERGSSKRKEKAAARNVSWGIEVQLPGKGRRVWKGSAHKLSTGGGGGGGGGGGSTASYGV